MVNFSANFENSLSSYQSSQKVSLDQSPVAMENLNPEQKDKVSKFQLFLRTRLISNYTVVAGYHLRQILTKKKENDMSETLFELIPMLPLIFQRHFLN